MNILNVWTILVLFLFGLGRVWQSLVFLWEDAMMAENIFLRFWFLFFCSNDSVHWMTCGLELYMRSVSSKFMLTIACRTDPFSFSHALVFHIWIFWNHHKVDSCACFSLVTCASLRIGIAESWLIFWVFPSANLIIFLNNALASDALCDFHYSFNPGLVRARSCAI